MIDETVCWMINGVADSINYNRAFKTKSAQPLIDIERPAVIRNHRAPSIIVQNVSVFASEAYPITELSAAEEVFDDLNQRSAID
jgi:hypothetical protein